ncbi:MAG: hypothetical protein AAF961_13045, partial [Planctomycetota bacterium]
AESDSAVLFAIGNRSWRIRTLGVEDEDAASLSNKDDECVVTCRVAGSSGAPITVRWRYSLELV